jgi:DNA-binding transcriptional MerR regulator
MGPLKFNTFSIGDTSAMTGVSQKRIRHWESRGFIPVAARSICGDRAYRRFTQQQVDVIKKIKEYLDQGYSLAAAANKAKQALKEGIL